MPIDKKIPRFVPFSLAEGDTCLFIEMASSRSSVEADTCLFLEMASSRSSVITLTRWQNSTC